MNTTEQYILGFCKAAAAAGADPRALLRSARPLLEKRGLSLGGASALASLALAIPLILNRRIKQRRALADQDWPFDAEFKYEK